MKTTIEDIKYITSQIIGISETYKIDIKRKISDKYAPRRKCNFSCKYLLNKNIKLFYKPNLYKDLQKLNRVELDIITPSKNIKINIRYQNLTNILGPISSRKRKIQKNMLSNIPFDSHFNNLITLDINNNFYDDKVVFNEIALLTGIYLHRNELLDSTFILDPFYKYLISEYFKRDIDLFNLDDPDKFIYLVNNFNYPFYKGSIRAYIKQLLFNKIARKEEIIPGLPNQTLYSWIRRGKLHLNKNGNYYQYDNIEINKIESLNKLRKERNEFREIGNLLAQIYSSNKGIKLDSAKRNIRRWRRKNKSWKEIAINMGINNLNSLKLK